MFGFYTMVIDLFTYEPLLLYLYNNNNILRTYTSTTRTSKTNELLMTRSWVSKLIIIYMRTTMPK